MKTACVFVTIVVALAVNTNAEMKITEFHAPEKDLDSTWEKEATLVNDTGFILQCYKQTTHSWKGESVSAFIAQVSKGGTKVATFGFADDGGDCSKLENLNGKLGFAEFEGNNIIKLSHENNWFGYTVPPSANYRSSEEVTKNFDMVDYMTGDTSVSSAARGSTWNPV